MTSTIIRAGEQNLGIQRVAFNFEDLSSQASRYLDGIRAEAAKIIAAAQQEANTIKAKAEAQGEAAAAKSINQLVQKQVTQQVATAMPALHATVVQIKDARQAWLAHWEKAAVRVATAIAGKIVRREIAQHPEIAIDMVRQALELAAGSGQIRLHLHPTDHAVLADRLPMVLKEFAGIGSAELIPDPAITAGGCRVETQFGIIDQQLEAQLARIEEELT
jgi:flagellar assembly protein FliH